MRNKGTKTSNVDLNRGMKVVRELDEHKWREFVDNHPEGRIFHTPEMFQVFARTRGHKPRLWAVVDEEDQVMALFTPVEITLLQRLLGRFASFTKRAVSYGSVLCACNMQGRRALALLFQAYVNQPGSRPIFTELRNLSNTGCIQSMICEHGFEYEEHLNYLIDINKPPEAIMQNIGKRTRKNIQRGLRKGIVKVVEARSPEQVEACYELLQKTYKNAQVPLADRSLFETAFQVLHPKGMIRFTLANVDQTPVAGSVELLYKDIVYGWY